MLLSLYKIILFGTYYVWNCTKEVKKVDRVKMKLLVSILMDSPLYQTMSHEERLTLLFALAKDYPNLLDASSFV